MSSKPRLASFSLKIHTLALLSLIRTAFTTSTSIYSPLWGGVGGGGWGWGVGVGVGSRTSRHNNDAHPQPLPTRGRVGPSLPLALIAHHTKSSCCFPIL